MLIVHVRKQNAAVTIRKRADFTNFEIFEIAPPVAEVLATAGKLVRQFPGHAVEVPNETAENVDFLQELASFLVQMDSEAMDPSALVANPRAHGAESRDSDHPRYISQLLVGILRGMGRSLNVRRIPKRIADEVLGSPSSPWRRSAVYLIIRVALQTTLPNKRNYKHFMVFFLTNIQERLTRHEFPSDLLFVTRAKVARRFYKLNTAVPKFTSQAVKEAAQLTDELLQKRWSAIQHTPKPHIWDPTKLDILGTEDTSLTLPNSCAYLLRALHPNHNTIAPSAFSPTHAPRLQSRDFREFEGTTLTNAVSVDSYIALADFETSVLDHLTQWVAQEISANRPSTACETIASCFGQYLIAATRLYTSDVADRSRMILILMELWVAVDRLATAHCPLLLKYSPEIPRSFLEPLLLRMRKSIERSIEIEKHLIQRHRAASSASIFSDHVDEQAFCIRYFQQSHELICLKKRIEKDAEQTRERRKEELNSANAQYRSLLQQASRREHERVQTGDGNTP